MLLKSKFIRSVVILLISYSALNIEAQEFYTTAGEKFPNFEMTDILGHSVSNATLKGKPSLIIFFGTRCSPCIQELKQLNTRLPITWYKKFNIYVIGSTDDASSLTKFNESRNYQFKYVPDQNQELFDKIGDHTIPRTFLIDENGKIISQTVGFNKTPFESLLARMKRMTI